MAVYLNGEEVGVIVNSGESPVTKGQYQCLAIDYDGTVLKEEWLNTGDEFILPSFPNHSGLIGYGWSSSVEVNDNKIIVGESNIIAGVIYKTTSGLTEIDIELTKATGLTVTCNMTGNKNWGDGTTDSETTHTYTNYGKYTITCDGTSIPGGTSESSGMFSSFDQPDPDIGNTINYYCLNVRIGENVTSIGSYAFINCYSIKTITIPNSVININSNSFRYCSALTTIIIPTSVSSIEEGLFDYCENTTRIVIPNGVTSIGENSFRGCGVLISISIPNSVVSIGDSAFQYCKSLKTVTFGENSQLTSIGNNAFSMCYSLSNIIIPGTVTNLTTGMFSSSGLQEVIISDGITNIDGAAVFNGTKLSKVTIPQSVVSINRNAFNSCSNLLEVKVLSSSITIGSSVFLYSDSILKFDFTSATSIPTLSNTSAFGSINGICKIYVPDALYDEWIVATNWATYADYIYKASEMED